MKSLLRFIGFSVLLSFLFSGTSCRKTAVGLLATETESPSVPCFLVAGIDDAAENTDVLFLCAFHDAEKKIDVVQIPRDTYCRFGKCQNKINQIFACDRLAGKTRKEALSHISETIGSLFGVDITASFGIDTDAFRLLIEAIDGVDVHLKNDATFSLGEEEITLPAGDNHLNGHAAEAFVRSRKGYAGGDLARLDVQKTFLSAVLTKMQKGLTPAQMISVLRILAQNTVTDANIGQLCSLYLSEKSAFSSSTPSFVTLPGRAALSESGLSYYIVSRNAAEKLVAEKLNATGKFDPKNLLAGGGYAPFETIYQSS